MTAEQIATKAIESILQGQEKALNQTAVTKALEGDSLALRLCMERIDPAPKDQPVSFRLPQMKSALDASEAAGSVLTAVSEGVSNPDRSNACNGAYRQLQAHFGADRDRRAASGFRTKLK